MESGIKISETQIASLIYIIRYEKVMLDSDLAKLYGVTTSRLNEQVKRNIGRFPTDFMFQLTKEEFQFLISQNATSKRGGRRKLPYAFTEHGAVMLASVLNTEIAVKASVEVVRGFVKLRELLSSSQSVSKKLADLELLMNERLDGQDEKIEMVFEALKQLLVQEAQPRNKIGYKK